MKAIQVVIRDLFGGVIFNQVFPNLPVAVASISVFLGIWQAPIGQVIILSPKMSGGFEKTVFKVCSEASGGFALKSPKGEKILLPEPILEEPPEDEDFFDMDEDDLEPLT